ncbi:helix-turn-helix transcriptional regulator [Paenarthrobacter sp. CCNWLY172]|uniref:helix-turn-helix transcriptional regulator n=1 Tax=unclassified Paenarthrobacter TaxID=2634190 RepID=UPI003077991B
MFVSGDQEAAAERVNGFHVALRIPDGTLEATPVRTAINRLAAHGNLQLTAQPQPRTGSDTFPNLTQRETAILAHVIAGRTYKEIADHFVISEKTVSTHISHLFAEDRHIKPYRPCPQSHRTIPNAVSDGQ